MALIKCPECKKQVSDEAYACMKCGYPFKKDMVIVKVPVLNICQLSDEKWQELTKQNSKKTMP